MIWECPRCAYIPASKRLWLTFASKLRGLEGSRDSSGSWGAHWLEAARAQGLCHMFWAYSGLAVGKYFLALWFLMPFVNFHTPYLHTDFHSLIHIAHTIAWGLITTISVFLSTQKLSAPELLSVSEAESVTPRSHLAAQQDLQERKLGMPQRTDAQKGIYTYACTCLLDGITLLW